MPPESPGATHPVSLLTVDEDDMVSELGLDRSYDLPDLSLEAGLLELGDHVSLSEPSEVSALALESGEKRVVLISLDILNISTYIVEEMRNAVEKATGIPFRVLKGGSFSCSGSARKNHKPF